MIVLALSLVSTVVGAKVACWSYPCISALRGSKRARELVDLDEPSFLADNLVNGVLEKDKDVVIPAPDKRGAEPESEPEILSKVDDGTDVGFIAPARIEMKLHRRIKKGRTGRVKRNALDAAKARFGTPKRTTANVAAVRRFVYNYLRENGVHESQMKQVIPDVIASVFIPDKYEASALELYNSWWSRYRRWSHATVASD